MLGVRLEPELEERLDWLAKQTGHTKSYHAKAAIKKYLEDREDYLIAVAALARKEETYSLDEVVRELGLEDRFPRTREKAAQSPRQARAGANSRLRARKTARAA